MYLLISTATPRSVRTLLANQAAEAVLSGCSPLTVVRPITGKCEIGYNTDLVLETRAAGEDKPHTCPALWISYLTAMHFPAGDGWPEMLEIGSGISATTYDRQYVVRMALFDSSAGQLDERGWTDIVLRLGTTVGDLRAAANELYGLDSENLILVKVDVHAVEEFLMPDDTSVRNSRPGIYSNGSLIVARDTRLEGGKSQVAALKAALSEEVRSDERHTCTVSQHVSDNESSRKILPHSLATV
jgi:hypothetical protein